MTYTNRCRPEYRHLSPAEECRLRGLRLGTIEVPGRVPGKDMTAIMQMPEHMIRARIMAALSEGPAKQGDLSRIVGSKRRLNAVLDGLIAEGRVVAYQVGRAMMCEVAQ